MSYIHEYKTFHKLASKAPMWHSWRDASSWGLLAEQANNLDYSNFKSHTHKTNPNPRFINALHDVWAVMTNTEDAEARIKR